MKKLILFFLIAFYISCTNSKNINEKEYSLYYMISMEMSADYLENARNGDCSTSNDYFNERRMFMGDGLKKGNWNYVDKTFLVDETPKFLVKQRSIGFDKVMFVYLYADIYCLGINKKNDDALVLINDALEIYKTNISGYYNANNLEFINKKIEQIKFFQNVLLKKNLTENN